MSAQALTDDVVATFTVDHAPLRGRIARLGAASIDPILRRHDYPAPVALFLGEALVFAALLASLLKAEGRLIVQAQGDGPVPLLVAEHNTGGGMRGYARLAANAGDKLNHARRVPPRELIGAAGVLAITLDQGPDFAPHQGFVPLEGETLAACAEAYFRDSEQTDTRLRLTVGELLTASAPPLWRGGGVLLQRVAADDARGGTEEGWNRATIFHQTLDDAEMLDPALPSDRLLYRLFHEDGVRMADVAPLADVCTCDEGRLAAVLANFSAEELDEMKDAQGLVEATCQFCARTYRLRLPD